MFTLTTIAVAAAAVVVVALMAVIENAGQVPDE